MKQSAAIVGALKRCLKAKRYTYKTLAKHLKLSEAAVKRAFSENSFSLKRLDEICEFLKVDLFTLAKIASNVTEEVEKFSLPQEELLAKNEDAFVCFYLLACGLPPNKIVERFKFSLPEIRKTLIKLETAELIETDAAGNARCRISQGVNWNQRGPLMVRYGQHYKTEFFDSTFEGTFEKTHFFAGNFSDASIRKLIVKLDQVIVEAKELSSSDQLIHSQTELRNITMMFGLRPWMFSLVQKYRRSERQ
jgi:transcriptional regulator with XRE-family HTH domain